MAQLKEILKFIFSHKLKYLVTLIAVLVFVVLMFPFQDVGDSVSSFVAKQTGNQVFVSFERLRASFLPLSVGADEFSLETPMFPAINAQEVQVTPSMGALISQKPEGTLIAKGLFKGDVEVTVRPGKKTEAGVSTHNLSLSAQRLSLAEIHKVAQLPMLLKGRVNLNASGTADPTFGDQPDFDIDLKVDQFELPAGSVETQMGPLNLPELMLSQVEIKGRLSAGRFNIERAIVGKEGDELVGNIKGGINLQIQNRGRIQPVIGAYQFDIDLSVKRSLQDKASLFLSFLENFKTPTADGARYQFKLQATSPQMPPNMSALR